MPDVAVSPKLCPCGCGQPARTKKGWGGRGCSLRGTVRSAEQRRATTEAWLKREGRAAHQMLSENGMKGGRDTLARWADLLEKWMNVGPREALRMAYSRGYLSGYTRGKKTRGGGRGLEKRANLERSA